MMSGSSGSPPTRVRLVAAAEPGTEIFVIDDTFQLCARGVGGLTAELEPGLYKLSYRAGSAISEAYQAIEPGAAPVHVSAPTVAYSSAAPLAGTRASDRCQETAHQLSRDVHATVGQGSQVFVFARTRPGSARRPRAARANPAAGLTLHRGDGALLVNLGKVAKRSGDDTDRCAGCTVALSPGRYRLRLVTPDWGHLEQVIVASPGWQTQVFLTQSPAGQDGGGLDPTQTSVLQVKLGQGLDARRDGLRLADLARIGLANQRALIPASELLDMMSGPFDNPMLGLYGAHASLMAGALDQAQLEGMVAKLRSLLGSQHPDVEALALALDGPASDYVFDCPPMLASSWSTVLEAAKAAPDLVPLGSLAERASPHLWGNGPWLLWLRDETARTLSSRRAPDPSDVVAHVAGAALLGHPDRSAALDTPELTDMEEALLARVARPFETLAVPRGSSPVPDAPPALSGAPPAVPSAPPAVPSTSQPDAQQARLDVSGDLVDALGIPPTAIPSVAASLTPKLERVVLTGVRFRNAQRLLRGLFARTRLGYRRGGTSGKQAWRGSRHLRNRRYATGVVAFLWLALVGWALFEMIIYPHGFTDPVDATCHSKSFSCGVVSGTLIILLSLALGYALFLARLWQVQRPYRRKARKEPQRVVESADSMIGEVVGRDELCQALIGDLHDRDTRRPRVLVGSAGAGKTALLIQLTKLLTEQGAVPVPVRLRDAQESLDFSELARRRFTADDNAMLLSDADGERIWRQLHRDDRVVVLADGLEEAFTDGRVAKERDNLIWLAIRQASERRLPLIIASYPHAPLRETEAAVVELEPLGETAALEYLRRDRGEDERRLDWLVETADVAETPLYLQITRQLRRAGLMEHVIPHSGDRGVDRAGLRLRLLEVWTQGLIDGHFATEVPLSRADRQATIQRLSVLACLGLQRDRLQVSFDEFGDTWMSERPPAVMTEADSALQERGRHFDVRLAATWGMRLGLVEVCGNGVRFPQSIIEAYLGSRVIDRAMDDAGYRENALDHPGREFLLALVMNSRAKVLSPGPKEGRPGDLATPGGSGRRFGDLLREEALTHPPGVTALYLYAAALQIDCVDRAPAHSEIAEQVANSWPELRAQDQRRLSKAKLHLVRRFGEAARTVAEQRRSDPGYPAEPAYPQLYRIALSEPSYPIRVEAMQEIAYGGDDAFNALRGDLDPRGGRNPPAGERSRQEQEGREQVVRAWLAPLLVGSVTLNAREVRENLGEWLRFVGERDGAAARFDLRLSLEVALAQGFKYAANRRGRHANPETWAFLVEQAREMLRRSTFWFTRLTLVHALCLWSLTDGPAQPPARRRSVPPGVLIQHWADRPDDQPEHPFVAEACQLAGWALETGQPERFIWIDERGVVARVGSGPANPGSSGEQALWIPPSAGWAALHPRAQKLVADVLVLLNLIERGEPSDRNRRLQRANRHDLPPCLTESPSALDPSRTVGTAVTAAPGSNCLNGCVFRLCPYPPSGEDDRIEFSEAFCRSQQAQSRDLRSFWRQMGRRSPG